MIYLLLYIQNYGCVNVPNNVLGSKCFTSDSASSVTLREMSRDLSLVKKRILRVPFLTVYLQSNSWEYGHGYFQPENFQSLTAATVLTTVLQIKVSSTAYSIRI